MIATYVSNVGAIITKLQNADIVPVAVTPPPIREGEQTLRMEVLTAALHELCESRGVELVDTYSAIADVSRLVSRSAFQALYRPDPDKHHLSVAGHAFVGGLPAWAAQLPDPDVSMVGSSYSAAISSALGNVGGKTWRAVIPASLLPDPPYGPPTWARLTLQGHVEEALVVTKLYAGRRGGGSTAATLYPQTWRAAPAFTVSAGSRLKLDAFPWTGGGDMIVSGFTPAGVADRLAAAVSGVSGVVTYLKNKDEASVLAPKDFTPFAGYLSLVCEIETDGYLPAS